MPTFYSYYKLNVKLTNIPQIWYNACMEAKMRDKYTVPEVTSMLFRKGCQVQTLIGKTISVPQGAKAERAGGIGNRTWGRIDFLCNYHGFSWHFMDACS
jgi:hypothetical protein